MGAGDDQLAEANCFLEPILRPSQRKAYDADISLVKLLFPRCNKNLTEGTIYSNRTTVAVQALQYLEAINQVLETPESSHSELDEILQTPQKRRTINALIDTISIEGIHPYLENGVGIPLEKRMYSTLKQWEISVERGVTSMTWDSGASTIFQDIQKLRQSSLISRMIDDRILVDFLAFMFQAAYSPSVKSIYAEQQVPCVIEGIATTKLLPIIASLLHPGAPDWLKHPLSRTLACAPVRKNGVRDTINFLASSQSVNNAMPRAKEATPSAGPVITTQTLERASQVMCTVPSSIEPQIWFESIGEQLLVFLSGCDYDEQKTAAFIIGAILSRRPIGSPGTPGWQWLALPLLGNISPSESSGLSEVWGKISAAISSDQPALHWAISCLSRLLFLHPNLGLIKRLGSRTYLNVWAVSCVSRTRAETRQVSADAIRILSTYVAVVGPDVILKLIKNFFFAGTDTWHYAVSTQDDCTAVRLIEGKPDFTTEISGARLVQLLESNMGVLIDILDNLKQDDLCNCFVALLNLWATNVALESDESAMHTDQMDAKANLVLTKAVHTILERYKAVLATRPVRMVPVVNSVLNQFVGAMKERGRSNNVGQFLIRGVINPDNLTDNQDDGSEEESLASFGLALLTIILMDAEGMDSLLKLGGIRTEIQATLSRLISLPNLPQTLGFSARAILMQLDTISKSDEPGSSAQRPETFRNDEADRYRQALSAISSSLAPIRAEGLNALNELIKAASLVISTPAVVSLLMTLLNEDDEYTHLNAVNTISLLVVNRPNEALAQLVEAYVDPHEMSTLEVRLRLGEAIQKAVKDIGNQVSPLLATKVAKGMIAVAGRRAVRSKEIERRAMEVKQQERDRKRAEREWGGEVPELPEEFREEVSPADEIAARIIKKWAGSGKEEDFRIRASALSITGILLAQTVWMLDEDVVESIVQLCLLTIQYETDEGAAILRRAAVVAFEELIVGMVNARRHGRSMDGKIGNKMMQEIIYSLERVRNDDIDEIARGHAVEVLKTIEESEAESLDIRLNGEDIRTDLGGRLRGLNVEPEATQGSCRPKIEEIE